MQTIAVIDYGMGNLRSVAKALEHVANHATIIISNDADAIKQADKIVFPGQGAALACMSALQLGELGACINEVAQSKPFLGVCMGMQVLMTQSAENNGVQCLGLLPGQVKSFAGHIGSEYKIPQMGWNRIKQRAHPLWDKIADNSHFYFVHSYFVQPDHQNIISGFCDYGIEFAAAIAQQNLFAIQAHPEKSARDGLQLLANFCAWDGTV